MAYRACSINTKNQKFRKNVGLIVHHLYLDFFLKIMPKNRTTFNQKRQLVKKRASFKQIFVIFVKKKASKTKTSGKNFVKKKAPKQKVKKTVKKKASKKKAHRVYLILVG